MPPCWILFPAIPAATSGHLAQKSTPCPTAELGGGGNLFGGAEHLNYIVEEILSSAEIFGEKKAA